MKNTENETQDLPRTAQEVQEILEARKRYKATPEGRKAGAAFAASIAKAKAEQKDKARRQARIDAAASQSVESAGLMLELEEERRTDRAKIVDLSESRQQAEYTTRKTEAEKMQIEAEAARFAEEVEQRDRARRRELRDIPFEKSRLAELASSTPRDFADELGRSQNYITDTAKKLGLQKTAGRWVFIQGDAQRDPRKLYDYLTAKMRDGFTTP